MTTWVLVYNAGGAEVLHVKPLQHAIRMLHRGVAVVREAFTGETFGPYERPRAIELVRYVYQRWIVYPAHGAGTATYSRSAVLRRDRHRCVYCGRPAATVDHVLPVSRGGPSSWDNVVAACAPCNGAKADRTPEQAAMPLRHAPWAPTWAELYAPDAPAPA